MDEKTLQNQGNEINDEDLSLSAAIAALKSEEGNTQPTDAIIEDNKPAGNTLYEMDAENVDENLVQEGDDTAEDISDPEEIESDDETSEDVGASSTDNILGGKKDLQRMSEELSFFVALQDNLTDEIDRLKTKLAEDDFDDLKRAKVMDRIDTLMIACAELQYSTDLSYALLLQYENRIKDLSKMLKTETNRELSDNLKKQISTLNTHAKGLADLLGVEWDEDEVSSTRISTRTQIQNMDETEIAEPKSTVAPKSDNTEMQTTEDVADSPEDLSDRAAEFENGLQDIINNESLSEEDIVASVENLLIEYKDLRDDPDVKPMIDSIVENFGIDLEALDARADRETEAPEEEVETDEEDTSEEDSVGDRVRKFQEEFDRVLSRENDDEVADGLNNLLVKYEDLSEIKAMQEVFAEIRDELNNYQKEKTTEGHNEKADKVDVAIMPNISIVMDKAERDAKKIDDNDGETADEKPVSANGTTRGNVLFDASRGDNFVTENEATETAHDTSMAEDDVEKNGDVEEASDDRVEAFKTELTKILEKEDDEEVAADLRAFMRKYADLENDEDLAPIFVQIREELADYEANKNEDNSKASDVDTVVVPVGNVPTREKGEYEQKSVASKPQEVHEGKTAGSTVSSIDPEELARAMNDTNKDATNNTPVSQPVAEEVESAQSITTPSVQEPVAEPTEETTETEETEEIPATDEGASEGRLAFEVIYNTESWESKEAFDKAIQDWMAKYEYENPEFTKWVKKNYKDSLGK